MDILTCFAENLSDLIFDHRLDPKEFSFAIGIDRSVIYKYLRKEVLPSVLHLVSICNYFSCSADYILGLETSNSKTKFLSAPPFSAQFRKLLEKENLTRYALRKDLLARNLRVAKQSIDDWYHGKRPPSVDNLVLLAQYFHCSVDYLLGRE